MTDRHSVGAEVTRFSTGAGGAVMMAEIRLA